MENILIVGSSGLLGQQLKEYLQNKYKIVCFARGKKNKLLSKTRLSEFFKHNKFDIIIYLSAITNIDRCEKFQTEAYNVNFINLKKYILLHLRKRINLCTYFYPLTSFTMTIKIILRKKRSL